MEINNRLQIILYIFIYSYQNNFFIVMSEYRKKNNLIATMSNLKFSTLIDISISYNLQSKSWILARIKDYF